MDNDKVHIFIKRGSEFRLEFAMADDVGTPFDFTGYKAAMQIRANIDAPGTLADLTTENSKITLVGDKFTAVLDAATTGAMEATDTAVYDIVLIQPDLAPVWLFGGNCQISKQVTHVD